jgi:hypothetical protein
MKHIQRVSVARAQQVTINLTDIANLLAWVGGMVWFVKQWNRF